MKCLKLPLLFLFLICTVPLQSNAFSVEFIRNLAEQGRLLSSTTDQVSSPAPSPFSSASLSSDNTSAPVNEQESESCQMVSNKCEVEDYSITACVPSAGNGSQEPYVLVVNDGERSLTLNVTVHPANNTVDNVIISGHQVKKVNLPSSPSRNSSISLHVEKEECTIHLGASIPESFYSSYLTPINGTYVLFATVILIGAVLAHRKFVKRGRHLNGVPYRELEMGQQESDPSLSIESPEGWEENWDEDWDEEKAVRSPGTDNMRKKLENGNSLKYGKNSQWGNDWDD